MFRVERTRMSCIVDVAHSATSSQRERRKLQYHS
jgi:hypothetical protein